jgi:hypothetical protein
MTYCSYVHFIFFLRSRTVGGNECHLTFLEVAGKTGCFPASSCAPKYVFTHYIGINSPFLRAINLFIIFLSTPDADDADANADAAYGNKRHPIQSKKDEGVIGHGIVGKDIPIMARLAEGRRWSKR